MNFTFVTLKYFVLQRKKRLEAERLKKEMEERLKKKMKEEEARKEAERLHKVWVWMNMV